MTEIPLFPVFLKLAFLFMVKKTRERNEKQPLSHILQSFCYALVKNM